MRWIKRATALASVALIAATMTFGCNTVRGAGRDVESSGKTVQKAANKTEDSIKEGHGKKCGCCGHHKAHTK